MAERETQLCVYYKGERVVDLWSSAGTDSDFSADSIVNVFSSGKSLAAIAMASLAGRGLLDYEAKIADYWPEFGKNGKQDLTVADLMRHEAGLAAFDAPIDPEDLFAENIRRNAVAPLIEAQSARFPDREGQRREYHAITRGWVANEIFRRADPEGRTIGQWLKEEIATPLEVDAIIGVEERDFSRISKVVPLGWGFLFLQSLLPRFPGRKVKHHLFTVLSRLFRTIGAMRKATTRRAPPPFAGWSGIGFFNERVVARGETPSAAANCSARGLAKIAAMMASRGKWDGKDYIAEEGWRAMHAEPTTSSMAFAPTIFTQGGVNRFVPSEPGSMEMVRAFNEGREGFYGWMGLGGSIFQWHPEHEIGFAFVPTSLHVLDIVNERGKVYQAEVLRCVERLEA